MSLGPARPALPRRRPATLMWADLVPKLTAADNPFAKLDKEQLAQLNTIADGARPQGPRGHDVVCAGAGRRAGAGARADEVRGRRGRVARASASRCPSSQTQRSTGRPYACRAICLPLEFSGKRVTEFLLVPWVGACIHTPPPPPNQIVLRQDHQAVRDGRRVPADLGDRPARRQGEPSSRCTWSTERRTSAIGYTLQATDVEPYKE